MILALIELPWNCKLVTAAWGELNDRQMAATIQSTMIRASAGSGKTFQLANRFLALMMLGESPEKIIALTFDPHPTTVFAPDRAPTLLTILTDRIELLKIHNADQVAVMKFTPEFAAMSPEDFVNRVLVDQLGATKVVVGKNFTYGSKAAGNVDSLKAHSGFQTIVLDLEPSDGEVVSILLSSFINSLACPKLPISISNYLNDYSEFFFDFDSYKLNESQKLNISNLSKMLMEYRHIKINIDGHASSEGESDYNMLLSNKRSISIKDILVKDGVNNSRLELRAYGENNPNYANIPLSERKKNRRVIISVKMDL